MPEANIMALRRNTENISGVIFCQFLVLCNTISIGTKYPLMLSSHG